MCKKQTSIPRSSTESEIMSFRCGRSSAIKLIWENQHLSLIMHFWSVLKDNVKWAKILLTITEPCLNPEFPQEQLKNTMLGKSAYFFMVLRYGGSCQEMCGTKLRVGEQNDSTTLQSINSMHWRPSFQRRRIEIRGRIVKSMLLICSEMHVLDTYWKTWHSMVSEQICTIDHKMD